MGPERRPRRGFRPLDARATTRPCSPSSPAPTWPVASTPGTRPSCAGSANWPPSGGCGSARRSPTATWPASGGAPWTCRRASWRRGGLPDRGAGGVRAGGRHPGVVRETARRALQPHRARRGPGRRRGRGRPPGRRYGPGLPVLGLPGSLLLAAAGEAGLAPVPEAFADRAYTAGGTLVPRGEPGAVLHDPDAVVARALGMAAEGRVTAADGSRSRRAARSALHGDTPGAAGSPRVRGRAGGGRGPGGGVRVRLRPRGGALRAEVAADRAGSAAEVAALHADCCAGGTPASWARLPDPWCRPPGPCCWTAYPTGALAGPDRRAGSCRRRGAAGPLVDRPGALRRPGPGGGGRPWAAWTPRGGPAPSPADVFRVAFCGFAPGFGYLAGSPGPPPAPPGHPPDGRPGRLAGAGRRSTRHVPALLPRRLAADRPHRGGPVGPGTRTGGAVRAGDPVRSTEAVMIRWCARPGR